MNQIAADIELRKYTVYERKMEKYEGRGKKPRAIRAPDTSSIAIITV